jgi:hypothetical protein
MQSSSPNAPRGLNLRWRINNPEAHRTAILVVFHHDIKTAERLK